jgi:quercetin dioxygenase-like cupin family protein
MKPLLFVPLTALLLTLMTSDEKVSSETICRSTTSWDGKTLPAYGTGQPEITIKRVTIPSGTTLPLHKHPIINAGVLLRGKLTVETDDGKRLVLSAGDPIVELVNQWHRGINQGDETVEILVFYAGTVGDTLTIKK